jgi:hypothetical protein
MRSVGEDGGAGGMSRMSRERMSPEGNVGLWFRTTREEQSRAYGWATSPDVSGVQYLRVSIYMYLPRTRIISLDEPPLSETGRT